jgi:hypothetical protein
LGHKYLIPTIFNGSDNVVIPDSYVASSNAVMAVGLSSYGTLSGTWHYVLLDAGGSSISNGTKIQDANATTYVDTALSANTIVMAAGGTVAARIYQSKVVELQGNIYNTPWTDYAGTSTITGWSAYAGGKYIFYKRIGNLVFVQFYINGTSDATSASFTLPFSGKSNGFTSAIAIQFMDNNTLSTTPGMAQLADNSAIVNCYSTWSGGGWTASNSKVVTGQLWYEIA